MNVRQPVHWVADVLNAIVKHAVEMGTVAVPKTAGAALGFQGICRIGANLSANSEPRCGVSTSKAR